MKRKQHRKNPEDNYYLCWNAPPFSRSIKVSKLKSKGKNSFTIKLNKRENSDLAKFLDVAQITHFSCQIDLEPIEGGWLVLGKINLVASQLCVITLEKVQTELRIPLKRLLVTVRDQPSSECAPLNLDLVDVDPLTEHLELGYMISEEIILMLPKYPRKKGVKLKQSNVLSGNDQKPNPFQKLADLKQSMEKISPSKIGK